MDVKDKILKNFNNMCDGEGCLKCRQEKQHNAEIEGEIKKLINELNSDLPSQEFFRIKNEILSLLDKIE